MECSHRDLEVFIYDNVLEEVTRLVINNFNGSVDFRYFIISEALFKELKSRKQPVMQIDELFIWGVKVAAKRYLISNKIIRKVCRKLS